MPLRAGLLGTGHWWPSDPPAKQVVSDSITLSQTVNTPPAALARAGSAPAWFAWVSQTFGCRILNELWVILTYNFAFGSAFMPTASTANESARINLRTSQEVKEMIERAAAAVGATVSSFMLQNATEVARRVLAEQEVIVMANRDRDAFLNALDHPPEPTQALIDLMRLYP